MKRLAVLCLALGSFFLATPYADAQKAKKEEIAKFIKELGSKDAKERLAAIDGIAKIGELKKIYAKESYEPLAALVTKDPDAQVREAAAYALGRIDADPDKAVPALIEGLQDKERRVVIASCNASGALGAGAKDALEMLRKINDEARAEQAKAKEEQAKYTADGDKEKAKLAQQRGQQFQQLSQAAGQAIRSIGGK